MATTQSTLLSSNGDGHVQIKSGSAISGEATPNIPSSGHDTPSGDLAPSKIGLNDEVATNGTGAKPAGSLEIAAATVDTAIGETNDHVGKVKADGYETDQEDEYTLKQTLADDLRYPSLAAPLEERRKSSQKRSLQASSYLILLEDRVRDLEKIVTALQTEKVDAKADAADDQTEAQPEANVHKSDDLRPVVAKLQWAAFSGAVSTTPLAKDVHVVELLIQRPYSFEVRSQSLGKRHRKHLDPPDEQSEALVQRIRHNSESLSRIFEEILDKDHYPKEAEDQLRPFKALVPYAEELRAKKEELEELLSNLPAPPEDSSVGDGEPKSSPLAHNETRSGGEAKQVPVFHDAAPLADSPLPGSDAKDIESDKERSDVVRSLEHLQPLLDCLNGNLAVEVARHQRLRACHTGGKAAGSTRVSFDELWHLFAPGDLVYDPKEYQALKVLAVTGGRQHLIEEHGDGKTIGAGGLPYEAGLDRGFDDHFAVGDFQRLTLTGTEQTSDFVLSCFYLRSNGARVGPIQTTRVIKAFEGLREIKDLALMPVAYAETESFSMGRTGESDIGERGKTVQQVLLERGRKYAELALKGQAAHREYSGFSLGSIREQLDSEVIVDLDYYHQSHPEAEPLFGLHQPPDAEAQETREKLLTLHESTIFDDSVVDKLRTDKYLRQHPYLVRWSEDQYQRFMLSADDCIILFPREMWGFVLRTREFTRLDVLRITEVAPRVQSFDELVLPDEHRRIVQGLVETHSRGLRPVQDAMGNKGLGEREDLVRGKGKGVIILLHGVPGVGKTSTAECVAEYTKRPLFSLTCGDIGDNAQDVEKNLRTNFQLAHRWGCVMLLDEADVFLQSRSTNRDLTRNAVVSVFLGMLEYYSGILFLTTNKIGTFDEAFKSRIHVSLYYQELDKEQTLKIWKLNLERIKKTRKGVVYEEKKMMRWMEKLYEQNENDEVRPWNGRQIRNACQTAAALAEFVNKDDPVKAS
ncbi:hypothetical protein MBLNU230_g6167t1 [Neophaeotheca triangularis]